MRLYSFVAAAVFATASLAAHAESIANEITFAPFAGYNSEAGTSFAQFNPTLGTLNSITVDFSATGTFTGGGGPRDFNYASYVFVIKGTGQNLLEPTAVEMLGPGTGTAYVTGSSTNVSPFIGLGTVSTLVSVTQGAGSANISSTFGTGTLTYNYTPPTAVAATPEPSSFALLGTALLGVAGAMRRRFA